jgi:predicted transcriptional regulator
MSGTSAKNRLLQVIREQPDDATFDQMLQELALARMVERGLADSDAGRTVSQEEVKRQIDSWRK